MHVDSDFLQRFICQMVPDAISLCKYRSAETTKSPVYNPSSSKPLHFDMIAVGAYRRGWVNRTLSRPFVRDAVERYAKGLGLTRNIADYPLECLSKSQENTILNNSIIAESIIVPDFYSSPSGKDGLLSGFMEAIKKHKFCSVDVDSLLTDAHWNEFFAALGNHQRK